MKKILLDENIIRLLLCDDKYFQNEKRNKTTEMLDME